MYINDLQDMPPPHRRLLITLAICAILAVQAIVPGIIAASDVKQAISQAIQQRMQPEEVAGRIVKFLTSADYEKAEGILSELLISRPIDIEGYRLLEKVYLLLSFAKHVQILDKWCENRPSSHFPFAIRGMHYYERARFLDGANQTLLLNENQRRNFKVYLHRSLADLEKAYNLNPQDPGPPATLAALAVQMKQPRTKMEEWFTISTDADPAWLAGYRAKLTYLAPWRHGSDQLMAQFASRCFENTEPGSNTVIVALDWIKLKFDRAGTSLNGVKFLTEPAVYTMMSEGIDRYADRFPLSPRIEIYRSMMDTVYTQPYVTIAAFSDALQHNPAATTLLKGRISAYLESRQFDPAGDDLQSLEQRNGQSPFSLVGRATILSHGLRDIDGGSLLYDQAISDETSPYRRKYYLLDRGELFRSYGRYPAAISDFSAAIEEDILFEHAYLGRAKSHYALGNLDAALADLMILKSSIRGRLVTHARSLINTYMKAERDKLTRANRQKSTPVLQQTEPEKDSGITVSRSKTEDRAHREFLIRGQQRFYQKDYEASRRDFYRAIAAKPTEAKAYFMLGKIAEQTDFDYVKARVFYEQAFRLDPAIPDFLLGVSRTRYRDRDFTAALHSLSGYLETVNETATDQQTIARLYFMRGLCREELGLIPDAVSDMQEALRLDPHLKAAAIFIKDYTPAGQSPGITAPTVSPGTPLLTPATEMNMEQLLEEGKQAISSGNAEQARDAFLKAIRLNPSLSEAYYYLGRTSFELEQDYPKARRYYSQAIDRDQGNPHYYFDRAAIHYYFRQYDPAVQDFTEVLNLQPNNQQAIYYRGVCNHMLGNSDAARRDFNTLRQGGSSWDMEIDRFRNAWNSEIEHFLNSVEQ